MKMIAYTCENGKELIERGLCALAWNREEAQIGDYVLLLGENDFRKINENTIDVYNAEIICELKRFI